MSPIVKHIIRSEIHVLVQDDKHTKLSGHMLFISCAIIVCVIEIILQVSPEFAAVFQVVFPSIAQEIFDFKNGL